MSLTINFGNVFQSISAQLQAAAARAPQSGGAVPVKLPAAPDQFEPAAPGRATSLVAGSAEPNDHYRPTGVPGTQPAQPAAPRSLADVFRSIFDALRQRFAGGSAPAPAQPAHAVLPAPGNPTSTVNPADHFRRPVHTTILTSIRQGAIAGND